MIDGKPLNEFQPNKFSYSMKLEGNTSKVPSITAVTNDLFASYQVDHVSGNPATAVIKVTSEDGTHTETYTVQFSNKTNHNQQ